MSSNHATRGSPLLENVVDRVGDILPAQGPIQAFIHHNTLHAFEARPFEEAIFEASRTFDTEPLLSEADYRKALRSGRILESDLDAELAPSLDGIVAGLPRKQFRRRLLVHGTRQARGTALAWLLTESDALSRFRDDVPGGGPKTSANNQSGAAPRLLWADCLAAIQGSPYAGSAVRDEPVRHRDFVRSALGLDTDSWVHPLLIRFVNAYLDQGIATWTMPLRERGLYPCFLNLHGRAVVRLGGATARGLAQLIADDVCHGRDAVASLDHSLAELGVPATEWEEFLTSEALSLRGWAGMVRQFELRPDRAPAVRLAARLVDFLAVMLLAQRAALGEATRRRLPSVRLRDLRTQLRRQLNVAPAPTIEERAFALFDVAQLAGLDSSGVRALDCDEIEAIEKELHEFDDHARRLVLHRAYERRFRLRLYDALTQHRPSRTERAALQAIFCIDEREESLRRHLEEADPAIETFGAAGFFGVAMYFSGLSDAQARPLCPVSVRPSHYVQEVPSTPDGLMTRFGRGGRRLLGHLGQRLHSGSRTFGRGALISAGLGSLWIVPLVLRVLFPWLRHGLSKVKPTLAGSPATRLRLERSPGTPPLGRFRGFEVSEMARIVKTQLEPLGIVGSIAPLVVVVGHGSTSLNNPQESAHDCGACGGGHGGANARAFAHIANDPAVRQELEAMGMKLPGHTWFIGAEHNTANNDIAFFDTQRLPQTHRAAFDQARARFETARRSEAHERCRRFDNVPSWAPESVALFHVQNRAADLAQPRPEYGHATNAACIVGRRSRTRGLFLDRRCFLVSYDPEADRDGTLLSSLLESVVPVALGINLEYFFGYVDPIGYGSGTKLPHNVAGLVGVMDGAQSDLRTGLPWQMLEIHEPMRLVLVVEARLELVQRVLETNAKLGQLVRNAWLFLACLHPSSGELTELGPHGLRRHVPESPLATVHGPSFAHYRGRRDHLPFVALATSCRSGQQA